MATEGGSAQGLRARTRVPDLTKLAGDLARIPGHDPAALPLAP